MMEEIDRFQVPNAVQEAEMQAEMRAEMRAEMQPLVSLRWPRFRSSVSFEHV